MQQKLGTLYGVSVGTGDPELITLKALKILQQTKVIAFPLGIGNKMGIAESIIDQWLDTKQLKVPLNFPYVKDTETLQSAWQESTNQLWQFLERGEDVAFACEGDVSFYSTFSHLANTFKQLHPDVPIKNIPGVCSPVAAAAELGIPLTTNSQRLTILPILDTLKELEIALANTEVLVLFKVSSVYEQVWQVLQQHNLLAHSYVVERATFSDRKIYRNLSNYPQLKLSYFSILIVNRNLNI